MFFEAIFRALAVRDKEKLSFGKLQNWSSPITFVHFKSIFFYLNLKKTTYIHSRLLPVREGRS